MPQSSRMTRRQREQLAALIATKRRTPRRAVPVTSPGLDTAAPQRGFTFSPARHGLSEAQCRIATEVLRRRERESPIPGSSKQAVFRRALRISGIISAVRHGRVGKGRWGRSMHGRLGGNRMRDHALAHLRTWSPVATLAARMAREKRAAQAVSGRQPVRSSPLAHPLRRPGRRRASVTSTSYGSKANGSR